MFHVRRDKLEIDLLKVVAGTLEDDMRTSQEVLQ